MDREADDFFGFARRWGYATDPAALDALDKRLWLDLWRAPVLDAVDDMGIETRHYGPVQATAVAELDESPQLNRLLGAAEAEAVADHHLEEALEWMQSLGVDHVVPLAPRRPESGGAEDLLNRWGYRRDGYLVRFVRDALPPDFPEPPGIEVDEVEEFLEGFSDYPVEAHQLDLVASCFFDCLPGRDAWRCYVAIDERERGIAAATMHLHYDVAQLAFAGTRESARCQGAHLALLRRRIHDAAAAGCRSLFAETEEQLDDFAGPSPAARNLVRAGFKQAAVRVLWRPE